MPSSHDRCPTCNGSGFIARGDQRYPCPTCSPSSGASGPYLAADPDESSALRIARSAAYGFGLVQQSAHRPRGSREKAEAWHGKVLARFGQGFSSRNRWFQWACILDRRLGRDPVLH